jgi:aminomethyltransferase
MTTYSVRFPKQPRNTALLNAEEWYQNLLVERLNRPYSPIQRSNFGQYDMAVHYLTSVLEEAKAVNKVAVFNIDHMAQIHFYGKDAAILLHRVLPANIETMKIGQCKYTLLLNDNGTVRDDLIIMKQAEDSYILVINAGHDITGKGIDHGHEVELLSDADFIMQYKNKDEEVFVKNLSDELVKVDVQGPYSLKLIKEIFGVDCVKNRNNPDKKMGFFSFNEIEIDGETYFFSRTGYTNRWGWEIYIPVKQAEEKFKQIVLKALDLGGLLVGLGGRDENRISAGNVGLPLMGQEYDGQHTPTNAPLFDAAIDLSKESFVGKEALVKDKDEKNDKRMVIIIAEGNVVNNGVYLNDKRLGSVTSCIVSPNVPQEKREYLGSSRKNVNEENGTAAIALAWLYDSPYEKDSEGKDIIEKDEQAIRIKVELYREKDGQKSGRPVLGYITADGITPATAPKALKNIDNL